MQNNYRRTRHRWIVLQYNDCTFSTATCENNIVRKDNINGFSIFPSDIVDYNNMNKFIDDNSSDLLTNINLRTL